MSPKRLVSVTLALFILTGLLLVGCNAIQPPQDRVRTELVTVVLVVTATPDPDATEAIVVVTATPDRTQVNVPDNIVPSQDAAPSSAIGGTPIDAQAEVTEENGIPGACIRHIIDDGDTIFGLAEEYGVNGFVMLEVNQLTEDEAANLRIGDELIVPLEGCPIELFLPTPTPTATNTLLPTQLTLPPTETPTPTASDTPENTNTPTATATPEMSPTPSVTPTITLPPTATESEMEIIGIIRAGDVTAEGVRIRNNGRFVDMDGWTLTDADGNEFTFADRLIFSNSELTLYTRLGENTAIASFWGLDDAVWQVGDVVTLRDADGDVQATYRVPDESADVP